MKEIADVAPRTECFVEFCAGAGQLGEGVRMAYEGARTAREIAPADDDTCGVGGGLAARPVCYVEIDLAPALVIAARVRDGALPDAPLWSNLKSWDPRPWRGLVDGFIGGYPCQPFSSAGKRLGTNDPRHIWPWIARHIRSVRPRWCFFENVGEHLRVGYHEVVRPDLESIGYRVTEILLSASDVGAPHGRERLFILAVRPDDGLADSGGARRARGQDARADRANATRDGGRGLEPERVGGAMADAIDDGVDGREQDAGERAVGRIAPRRSGRDGLERVADADGLDDRLASSGGRGPSRGSPPVAGGTLDDADDGTGQHEPRELQDQRGGIARRAGRSRMAYPDGGGLAAVAAPATDGPHADERNEGLAHTDEVERRSRRAGRAGAIRSGTHAEPARSGEVMGNADRAGLEGRERPERCDADEWAPRPAGPALAYGPYGGWPPGPGDERAWRRIIAERPDLAPATQSVVRGGPHGVAGGMDLSRADRLHIIGNGVVPVQVAAAFTLLAAELGFDLT